MPRLRSSRYVLLALTLLAAAVFAFVYFESRASRSELYQILRNESLTLVETLNNSIRNSLEANNEIEELLIKRLNASAELAASTIRISPQKLQEIASEFDINNFYIINPDGRILSSNDTAAIGREISDDVLAIGEPVFIGEYEWSEIGIIPDPVSGEDIYMILRRAGGDYVIAGYDMQKLMQFRRRIGIGRQIRDIGNNPDIAYIAMQDTEGVFAASANISELSSIGRDTFLLEALRSNRPLTRARKYEGEEVYEVVAPVDPETGGLMLTRIALRLDNVQSIYSRTLRRTALIGIGIFAAGLLLAGMLLVREKLGTLRREHRFVRQYTGAILNNMADAVVAVGEDGLISVFNPSAADLFAVSEDSAIGRRYEELFPEDEILVRRARAENTPVPFIEKDIRVGKFRKTIGLSVSIISGSEGGAIVAVVRDLTDIRRIREKLEQRKKLTAMGELAAGVAHEIRNPLNAINVIAQRFAFEFHPREDEAEYKKLIKTVREEVARVNGIIRQFLEFARPAALKAEPVALREIIADSVAVIESQAASQGVDIIYNVPDNLASELDHGKFRQALLNLLRNSLEAMPQGGAITVSAAESGEFNEIVIADTGPGIPEEIRQKIFNLYFTTKPTGTGLGLSIVHQIISEHGGEISFTPESTRGASVRILIPKI